MNGFQWAHFGFYKITTSILYVSKQFIVKQDIIACDLRELSMFLITKTLDFKNWY